MMMARTPRVAIIGGGIGGLTAALAMRQRGIDVAVFEQSPKLSEAGAGIQLSPNAMKVFRALGLEERILAAGFETENQVTRDWKSGRILASSRRKGAFQERFGAGHCCIHRADLLEILNEDLLGRVLHLSARCVSTQSEGGFAQARFDDDDEIEADIIVGADGIHSAVRTSLFGAEAPRFTGSMCWRGLVPSEVIPPALMAPDGTLWLGPHGHVVHYYVRQGALLNFIAVHETPSWTEESWTTEGDREELMAAHEGWNEAVLRLFACSENCYKWALYDREPLDSWTRGRVTLLGDSAHAMLPALGQGACMSIEDGYVLAALIASMPDDLDGALQLYEQMRIPRTRRAQLGSRLRSAEHNLVSPWGRMMRNLRYTARRWLNEDGTNHGASWLYGYDATARGQFPPLD